MARNRSKVDYRGITAYFTDSREAQLIQEIIDRQDAESIADGFLDYNYVWVKDIDDLPDCVGDVITLAENTTYYFTGTVDLAGCRLAATNDNSVILGPSSENARITSTGLGVGIPLLTIEYTLPCRHVTFQDVDTCIQVNGAANAPVALDWTGVNFENIPNIGEIDTCDNFIYSKGAFLNSKGLTCTGSIGTLGFDNSIFVGDAAAGAIFDISATCTITRRFRIIYSAFVVFGATVGIDVDASATVPTESFILDTVNFGAGGTYLGGLDDTSNTSLFRFCKGITNTTVNGNMYMNNNVTATTVSDVSTFYKVAGATTNGLNNKFTGTDNRLTCNATIPRRFQVIVTLTYTTGSNNVCEFAIYDSAMSDYCTPSRTHSTANSGGRAENITMMCLMEMEDTDYIEVHCANDTGTTDITVEDMNVTIIEI